jgi:putative membrane protein
MDALAQMDRIRGTPIPLAYLIHMKQAITAYCFILPLTMVNVLQVVTVPLVALVALLLFGIDGIGAEIENPFGTELNDLPIDYLCHEMAKEAEYIEAHIPPSATLEQALGSCC